MGWSKTSPGTTGYIIPTILRTGALLGDDGAIDRARGFAEFLVDIQRPEGGWLDEAWPPRRDVQIGIFNTAQIVKGLCALWRAAPEDRWIDAAARGARWLARAVGEADGSYPAYYTQVAWPLLEVWQITGERELRAAAVRMLDGLLARRTLLGAFRGWGIGASDRAFTHTIAYTLRGFLESARLLDDWKRYGAPAAPALRRLAEDAIANRGRLAGTYDTRWRTEDWYSCLTGNAQIAVCLWLVEEREGQPLFGQAARALIDEVCRRQVIDHPIPGIRGAVPGSSPFWGTYMRGRYPNRAAKYLCDGIVTALERNVAIPARERTYAVRR